MSFHIPYIQRYVARFYFEQSSIVVMIMISALKLKSTKTLCTGNCHLSKYFKTPNPMDSIPSALCNQLHDT